MAKSKKKTVVFPFMVSVTAPAGTKKEDAQALLQKFIDIGEQDAIDSVEIAEENGDTEEVDFANACDVDVKAAPVGVGGYVVINLVDGEIQGGAKFKPTQDEANALALEMVREQSESPDEEFDEEDEEFDENAARGELEEFGSFTGDGWSVYVLSVE